MLANAIQGKTMSGGYKTGVNPDYDPVNDPSKGTQSEGKEGEQEAKDAAKGSQAQQQSEAEQGFAATQAQTAANAAAEGLAPDSHETNNPGASFASQGFPDSGAAVAADQAAAAAEAAAAAQSAADQADADQGAAVGDTSGPGSDSSGDGTGGEARGGLNVNGKYYPPEYARGGKIRPFFSPITGKYQANAPQMYAQGGIAALASGGLGSLGGYSDGGRLLRGPGDGVSDSIPATIGRKQPARLADGEFIVPARIVSELGNGSTEAGARQLYAMMDRIQAGRRKTMGKTKTAVDGKSVRHLPA